MSSFYKEKSLIIIVFILTILFFSGNFSYAENIDENPAASSENFKAAQINLNSEIGSSMTEFEESSLLGISDIKSELYSVKDGDKNEVRAIISCKTSRKAFIGVKYFKSGEKNGKMVKDVYSGFSHTLIISALDIDSVYKYSISAVDVSGNKAESEQLVFYTGAPSISLIDTLENAFRKVFGWAIGG